MVAVPRPHPLPRIVHNARIHGGEPTVEGTRVPVRSVVILFEQYGNLTDVYRGLPGLPPGGAEAALAYYADHRQEIDDRLAELAEDDDEP